MLEFLKNPAKMRKAITEKSRIPETEVAEMVKRKQEEFYGLINEAAALYLTTKELGIELEVEKDELRFTPLEELSSDMQNVNIHAKVMRVLAPRKFERNGRSGRVCSLVIGDKSGEATLVLWNRDVELVEKGVIEKGDVVDVLGAYVKESKEVHLPMGGQVLKVNSRATLPDVVGGLRKITEIREGVENIDLIAEVLEVGAINSFQKEGRVKYVSSIVVADESGKVRVTLWDGNAELVRRMKSGDRIKVENAYAKKGAFGRELHADWRSRIILNPRNVKLPRIKAVEAERRRIVDLKEGMAAEVEGGVTSATARLYEMCGRCGSSVQKDVCPKCGSTEIKRGVVVNAVLDDGSGRIGIVLFDRNARGFLGLKEMPADVDAGTVIELKKDEIVGRKVVADGNVMRNKVTNELEFIVKGLV
ncbi:MAG: replication factor A1 [Candidatus Fermentimicrarchaeum limneticum]|uniref:Replication factor A1 n=1 Tax=Fermentimicrarchaeum limneticum TaxID=2795018 RepID=A0A7D5XKN7_FERL1|nr:MAG: replication factor A1 [Candidatus Fermentimicrarchaeum limneticum]